MLSLQSPHSHRGAGRPEAAQTRAGRRRAATLIVALSTVLATAVTSAQTPASPSYEDLDEAQIEALLQLIEQVRLAESEQRWADALELYEAMSAILPLQEYRLPQAICHERLGADSRALVIYRELMSSDRPEIAELAATRAERVAERLAELPARLRVATDRLGALVLLDDQARGHTDSGGIVIETHAGPHRVAVELDGYVSAERDVVVEPNEEITITITLEPLASADPDTTDATRADGETTEQGEPDTTSQGSDAVEPPETGDTSGRQRRLGPTIGLSSAASAAAISGIVLGVMANSRADDAWAAFNRNESAERVSDLNARSDRLATSSTVSFLLAGGLAVGAVIAFLMSNDPEPTDDSTPRVSALAPIVSPRVSGAALTIRW